MADFSYHSACIQIKLLWVGMAILGILCGTEALNLR